MKTYATILFSVILLLGCKKEPSRPLVPKEPTITGQQAMEIANAYLERKGFSWGKPESVRLVKPCHDFDRSDEGGSCYEVRYHLTKEDLKANETFKGLAGNPKIVNVSGDGSTAREVIYN